MSIEHYENKGKGCFFRDDLVISCCLNALEYCRSSQPLAGSVQADRLTSFPLHHIPVDRAEFSVLWFRIKLDLCWIGDFEAHTLDFRQVLARVTGGQSDLEHNRQKSQEGCISGTN